MLLNSLGRQVFCITEVIRHDRVCISELCGGIQILGCDAKEK